MPVIGPSIPEYQYYPEAPPSLIGAIGVTGLSTTIELWTGSTRLNVLPSVSGCQEIGDTGKYAWSMAHLPRPEKSRVQYHFRITDGAGNADEGDFILVSVRGISAMPSRAAMSGCMIRF